MKFLIINADDFGLTEGVNAGIIDCLRNGILTSATAMVNMFCEIWPRIRPWVTIISENSDVCAVDKAERNDVLVA